MPCDLQPSECDFVPRQPYEVSQHHKESAPDTLRNRGPYLSSYENLYLLPVVKFGR